MRRNDNISYEDYLELIRHEVSARTGKHVKLQTIRKNNGLVLDGLTILSEETNVSPTIYLNNYYKVFLTDGTDAVVDKVIALYEENKVDVPFDLSRLTEISQVKPFIKMKLINYEKNKQLLVETPHIKLLDLAVVFIIMVRTEADNQFGTILVHSGFLAYWQITEAELYQLAKENMANDFQTISMQKMISVVMKQEFIEELAVDMYMLTTHSRLHGAVGMLQTKLLNAFMQKHQTEKLIILPLSIHEVLLIPYSEKTTEMDFQGMVREVNATSLSEEEILSDSVYVYDGNELKLFE